MANDFGALTDHFGILALTHLEGTMADILELVDSGKTPIPESRADAPDEYEDVAASTYYGNDGGTLYDAYSTFALKSGTLNLNELQIGELATGKVVESFDCDTKNSQWPQLKFTGKLGMAAIQVPAGSTAKATLPDIEIIGAKMAQLMSFTIGATGRLTGCSIKCTGKISQQNDGLGEPVAYAINFPEPSVVTAEQVRVSGQPTWTVTSPMVEKQAPSAIEPQAAYHTSTAIGEIPLARDSA